MVRDFWTRLTAPSPALTQADERRQARLLAQLSLLSILSSLPLQWTYQLSLESRPDTSIPLKIAAVIALGLVYWISRTRYYRAGITLFIAISAFAIYGMSFSSPVQPDVESLA
ncbi:MAG: hypothetical protein JXB35_03850, partial [Anaerolineae bacterium]|nr:hypothetical protein [Anaerolineae bacterium]